MVDLHFLPTAELIALLVAYVSRNVMGSDSQVRKKLNKL